MQSEFIFLLIPAICWLLLIPALVFAHRHSGHLPFAGVFFWVLLGLFLVFTPISDHLLGIRESFGFTLPRSFEINKTISLVYSLAMLGFGFGLSLAAFLLGKKQFTLPIRVEKGQFSAIRILYGFQLLVWMIYFLNLHFSGISLTGLFNPFNQSEAGILFSAAYSFPLLELFSAAIPVCLFLLLVQGENRRPVWWLFFLFWLMMSLLGGWRFRIILFGLFCLLYFFQSGKFKLKHGLFAFSLLISMAWLTLNRMAIAKRQFDFVTFDLSQFDLRVWNNEFSNCRTFRACLSLPAASEFPGIRGWMKEGPDEMPRLIALSKSWIPPGWPWNPNPALSQPEEFYLLFGWSGLFLMMAFVGMLCAWLDRLRNGFYARMFSVVMTALLFQWISRGYFPFQLKITLICLLPFLLLWIAGPYLSPNSNGNKAGSLQ